MGQITLPEEILFGLRHLLSLNSGQQESLYEALLNERPKLHGSDLAKSLSAKVSDIDADITKDIIKSLVINYSVCESSQSTLSTFITDIAQAVDEEGKPAFPPSEASYVMETLRKFLSLESPLGITAKANNVLLEHQRTFCGVRIMTDVRPVFTKNLDSSISCSVIFHTLRIGYHEYSEHKEFFVALDSRDLALLKDALDRADSKRKAITKMCRDSDITLLDVMTGESS